MSLRWLWGRAFRSVAPHRGAWAERWLGGLLLALAGLFAALPLAAWSQDAGVPQGRRKPVSWRLVVEAPSPLDRLLQSNLDLARFQPEDGVSRGELRRLVAAVPEQARSLLDAEGYFAAQVRILVKESSVDAQAHEPEAKPQDDASGDAAMAARDAVERNDVTVTVRIEPGPRAHVSRVQFVFEGALDQRLSEGDRVAQALADQLAAKWSLPAGEVFRQSAWASAKTDTLARLRADTYPLATWSGTSATVDAEAHTASLFLVADSGPAFAFGPIQVEGLTRQPASAIVNLAPFKPGGPYRERQLLDWQERIQKLGMFEGVFVSPALDVSHPESTPLVVQVRELPLQSATAGIGISSDNGPRLSLEHLHRNVFGLDWQAKTKVQLGARLQDAQLDLTSHPWEGHKRGLVSVQTTGLTDSDNAVTHSQRLRVGLLREGERLAVKHLRRLGYKIVGTGVRNSLGELPAQTRTRLEGKYGNAPIENDSLTTPYGRLARSRPKASISDLPCSDL